jgi:ACS family tartrate transporter-like MFS transporter
MVVNSRHSDRTRERHLHVAAPLLLGGVLLFASVLSSKSSALLSFALLSVAGAGFYSSLGPLWTIPTEGLTAKSAGAAAGLVNAVGNLGGYFGPLVVGVLRSRTGDFRMAFAVLSASLLLAGILALLLKLSRVMTLPGTKGSPFGGRKIVGGFAERHPHDPG